MPGFRFFRAQGTIVKLFCFLESLESQAFGGQAAHGHEAGTLAQAALELSPFLFVKFCSYAEGVVGALFLVGFERSEELRAERVILGGELFDPFFHYLSVADGAESPEKLTSDFAHFWPRGVGVHFFHYGSKGPAAADGDTEIVDGVGIGRVLQTF